MKEIYFNYGEYAFSSVAKSEIIEVSNWLIDNSKDCSFININKDEVVVRFLESYFSEDEVLIKICKEERILGILKGRVEYSYKVDLLILLYIIENNERGKGVGRQALNLIIDRFSKDFKVTRVKTFVNKGCLSAIRFWESESFNNDRVIKKYFVNNNNDSSDLIVLSKELEDIN